MSLRSNLEQPPILPNYSPMRNQRFICICLCMIVCVAYLNVWRTSFAFIFRGSNPLTRSLDPHKCFWLGSKNGSPITQTLNPTPCTLNPEPSHDMSFRSAALVVGAGVMPSKANKDRRAVLLVDEPLGRWGLGPW